MGFILFLTYHKIVLYVDQPAMTLLYLRFPVMVSRALGSGCELAPAGRASAAVLYQVFASAAAWWVRVF